VRQHRRSAHTRKCSINTTFCTFVRSSALALFLGRGVAPASAGAEADFFAVQGDGGGGTGATRHMVRTHHLSKVCNSDAVTGGITYCTLRDLTRTAAPVCGGLQLSNN
jgi:hypothetical protein